MDRLQLVDLALHRLGQFVIRQMHVDVLRVAAAARQCHRVEDRRLGRRRVVRVIGVEGIARDHAPVAEEFLVRHVIHLGKPGMWWSFLSCGCNSPQSCTARLKSAGSYFWARTTMTWCCATARLSAAWVSASTGLVRSRPRISAPVCGVSGVSVYAMAARAVGWWRPRVYGRSRGASNRPLL